MAELLPVPRDPDIHVSQIVAEVIREHPGWGRLAQIEECGRRVAVAVRQEASQRILRAASLKAAWDDVMAIAIEGE